MTINRHKLMKQKRHRRKKVWKFIGVPLLVLLLATTSYGAYLYYVAKDTLGAASKDNELSEREKSDKRSDKVNPKNDNISILFMGVDDSDSREYGTATRTDALILATFNENQKTVKLVSIPRDSYVHFPFNNDYDKINHAHVFGGVEGTVQTVEELFDIPVDYYVKLNFNAFIDMVEALGGIEVDVPITFSEQDSKDRKNAIRLKKGLQTLTGEEALALARTRKIDNDIERGKRQQLVLEAIIKKAISVGSVTKYGNLIEAVGTNMKTNMTFEEMLSFHDYATAGSNFSIQSLQLEGEDDYINRVYYYKLKDESVQSLKQELKTHLEVNSKSDPSHVAQPLDDNTDLPDEKQS
ncbi:LCP family protein [Bacillus salitolerans]|uniref:LCP family protein n=1 Tax=Bacillus salitolerans TaxID=1437434 RepID=A0ABW4LQP6_9BACI